MAPATVSWDAGPHDLQNKTSTHATLPRQRDWEETTDEVVMVTAACEMRCWLKWREVRKRRRRWRRGVIGCWRREALG